MNRKTCTPGINIIKQSESCRLKAYLCPAGKWTIGYGHTGADVSPGMIITQARAEELLLKDLAEAERGVNLLVKSFINQNQFDALVSFAFNCGTDIDTDLIAEGLGDSTLLKLVNANPHDIRIAGEFARWNKSKGIVLPGLTRRRASEAKLYFS